MLNTYYIHTLFSNILLHLNLENPWNCCYNHRYSETLFSTFYGRNGTIFPISPPSFPQGLFFQSSTSYALPTCSLKSGFAESPSCIYGVDLCVLRFSLLLWIPLQSLDCFLTSQPLLRIYNGFSISFFYEEPLIPCRTSFIGCYVSFCLLFFFSTGVIGKLTTCIEFLECFIFSWF